MDDKERSRRHLIEAKRQADLAEAIPEDTVREIIALLERALKEIRATLGGQPSEWQQHHLSLVKASVKSALDEFRRHADGRLSRDAMRAWYVGQNMVDEPLAAAGVAMRDALPTLNTRQLINTQTFLTDRITDISEQAIRRINGELGLVMLGVQTPGEVTTALTRILNISRSRASTIARTELGRLYEVAAFERRLQAKTILPGLKKQWRRSGKIHSRLTHDAADGQIREPDEDFIVGGEALAHPRDPKGSAKNTINCGCSSLDYMDDWDVMHPGKKPFTAAELAANPLRRNLSSS